MAQVNGHSYVDLEALARVVGGTLTYRNGRAVLTVPGLAADAAPAAVQPAPTAATAEQPAQRPVLTRDFVTAGVQAVSQMREWRTTLAHAVANNQPVTTDLLGPFQRQSETQVALAAAAARTDPDRSAATLLQNELANLRTLSSNYISTHDTITNIRTDALDTDPLHAKVVSCLQALAGMQAGGSFQDVSTCH